jgi:hypothetical protein
MKGSFGREIHLVQEGDHEWRRKSRPCHGAPEVEDIVGTITMINSAMLSSLMGYSYHLSMGL